jgi:putative membrane protein
MIRMLISTAIHFAANAIGLVVAAMVLDDMSIDGVAFLIALLIFTAVEVIAQPLIQRIAIRNAHALVGSVALVTTYLGLLVTDLVSDGLTIEGMWTWVLATIIVWLAAMLAGVILPMIFLKEAVGQVRDGDQSDGAMRTR